MIRRPPRSTLFPYRRSSDLSGGLPAHARGRGAAPRRAEARVGAAAAALRRYPSPSRPGVDCRAPPPSRRRHRAPSLQAQRSPLLRLRLDRAADWRARVRIPELRGGMTARPFAGLRVTLVAAFNPRYHRSGLALAAALGELGGEGRRRE